MSHVRALKSIRTCSLPHVIRAGTIKVSRPVFNTPKYIESNGILSNYMIIFRVDPINDHIITQNTIIFYVFYGYKIRVGWLP